MSVRHAKEQSSGLEFHGKLVRLGIFPVGIEPKQFTETLEKPAVKARVASLNQQNQGRKVIVGVDRVDYIKGIPQKLNALDQFLDQHPEWVGKVVMVQVAIPSREEVKEYSDLANTLHEEVHRINLKHGKLIQERYPNVSLPLTPPRHHRLQRLPTHKPDALLRPIRRTSSTLRHLRHLLSLFDTRRHEPRFVRIHRLAKRAPGRPVPLRVRRRRRTTQGEPALQPVGPGRHGQRHLQSRHHEPTPERNQLQEVSDVRRSKHERCLGAVFLNCAEEGGSVGPAASQDSTSKSRRRAGVLQVGASQSTLDNLQVQQRVLARFSFSA